MRLAAVCLLLSAALCRAEVTLHGRVVDENDAPVRDARVSAASSQAQTDPNGRFSLNLPAPGDYLVSVERQGYYALKDHGVHVEGSTDVTFAINSVREVFQSENVNAETSPLDVDQAQNQEHLTGTEVNNVPYSSSHSLRKSFALMPGVVEDPTGGLHVNGSSENQVNYLLNGFDITNPISGRFQTLLAVEGIRSVDLITGRLSPDLGKGTAGALGIRTENGTDAFHYTMTDFIPGVNYQQGLRLNNWYPRVGFSGPMVRGRAWFSDTFDSEYNQSVVTGLPKGQDTRSGWAGSNLLHTQANLTPSNLLFADFLVNTDNAERVGLSPLNPVSTTTTMHSRQYFGSIKDQQYFGHGWLAEFGYAHGDFSNRQTPQGQELYQITPTGTGGNNFVNSSQGATRDQGIVHLYLPKLQLAGAHQIETGGEVDGLNYDGSFQRTGYQVFGDAGQLISQTLFGPPALVHTGDKQAAFFLLDTWRMAKRLQLNLGVREDWDQSISDTAWSPRLGFTWSPFASSRTRISGGYAITHDVVTLGMLGLALDQAAFTTSYNANGAPVGPAAPNTFAIRSSGLVLPRATNWTLGLDHQLTERLIVSAKYLRRRGRDGFVFVNTLAPEAPPLLLPVPSGTEGGAYQLTNQRRDDYDSVQISARQTFSGQFEWMASYTWSRANSNVLIDPNFPQPLQVLPGLVPMPWDAPHRFLGWTYLPLPWKNWAVSALADARTGFPFSVREPEGTVAGAVDSYRFPFNFDLNLAIERMLIFRGYRFALRGGVDNLTDQANPTQVNNVIGVPQYLHFVGDEGRHFVVRIRFFGRVETKSATQ